MDSWWDLGEWSGVEGEKLNLHEVTCPFCFESGNFSIAFHAEKKKANSHKILNFDTLLCNNCKGYVMVLWSATSDYHAIHDSYVVPWPLKFDKYPKHWPETVGRFWLQAHRNLLDENWDASAIMARSSLQAALRELGAVGKNLFQEIEDLSKKGILPPLINNWSHELRELGNESTHADISKSGTQRQDARDIVKFLDFLMQYLFDLPNEINEYRKRKTKS